MFNLFRTRKLVEWDFILIVSVLGMWGVSVTTQFSVNPALSSLPLVSFESISHAFILFYEQKGC